MVLPAGGTIPSSTVVPPAREGGQPVVKDGPVAEVAEVTPSIPSSILAKRKQDGDTEV